MVGRTLVDIRNRLDELSVAVGPYRVVSARTGSAPYPITGRQFPDRATAAEAAAVATAYRTALRRYDPGVAVHNLIVCEGTGGVERPEPSLTLPEYYHTIAAALFETLAGQHRSVERAVMDTYLSAAENTENREKLCLELVASMASAIDCHLEPGEQADLLLSTARSLSRRKTDQAPLPDTLQTLEAVGALDDWSITPAPGAAGRQSYRIQLRSFRPTLSEDACPVLPLVVELLRRTSIPPRLDDVTRTEDGWTVRIATAGDRPVTGLAVARTAD